MESQGALLRQVRAMADDHRDMVGLSDVAEISVEEVLLNASLDLLVMAERLATKTLLSHLRAEHGTD